MYKYIHIYMHIWYTNSSNSLICDSSVISEIVCTLIFVYFQFASPKQPLPCHFEVAY